MFGRWFIAWVGLVGLAAAQGATAAERAGDVGLIAVEMDQARVLKMPRPASTVIVGNPAIADVSVQDARTMVLTGRSYGITNLIVLDENGETMIDRKVGVRTFEDGTVRIYRQAQRETVSCSPQCAPMPTVGDASFAFSETKAQIEDRQKLAISSAQGN